MITLLLLGVFSAGVAYAGVTLMSDEGFFDDGNKVVVEKDYTTWTKVWNNTLPEGLYDCDDLTFHIDEKIDVLYCTWRDDVTAKSRFGIFNLADFSVVFNSTSGDYYQAPYFTGMYEFGYIPGMACLDDGGVATSLTSYIMLVQWGTTHTIDVWRGGVVPLWSRDIRLDTGSDTEGVYLGLISSTGKYILIYENWYDELILYKGS